jgi:nucleoside-triphosphatase THEP1
MTLNLQKFFKATNPGKTLFVDNSEEDQKYYIDFSSVRGGQIIDHLKDQITMWSPDAPTCQLFTGHIGCGKSTELLRLKAKLEQSGFHVVYFESSQDLEMEDVDVADILLTIARRVSESLEEGGISLKPGYFKNLFREISEVLLTPMEISEVKFSVGVAEITSQTKANPKLREKVRGYLEPRTTGILGAINEELLKPAIEQLKRHGKKGLVVIVDNLDRIQSNQKPWGRLQPEYLFVDRGEQLRQLKCHVIYTMPLGLIFSNDFGPLTERFMVSPQVLPMVPVRLQDGSECTEGMALLRQMVLARAFPDVVPQQRIGLIPKIFDSPQTLDRLCRSSGGHMRSLLRLLLDCIRKEKQLPLSSNSLEEVIQERCNQMALAIDDKEWDLLRQVAKQKKVSGDEGYQTLIRSLYVFEYRAQNKPWFDINPILTEAEAFNS